MSARSIDVEPSVRDVSSHFPIPKNVFALRVQDVFHYTDRLFKFRLNRPDNFRFRSGEFVMIGLPNAEKPVYRAYSIASPSWDEQLEFYSIKVLGGLLTEQLQKVVTGDTVLMRAKSTGTLVIDALVPGKRLYLLSTGTGIAPFISLIHDPETYEKFSQVILVQTTREKSGLIYAKEHVSSLQKDPLVSEHAQKFMFYPMTTREPSEYMGRITTLMKSGAFFERTGLPRINPSEDRVMVCGSVEMIKDCMAMCEDFGLVEGANSAPATYVVERAFVS